MVHVAVVVAVLGIVTIRIVVHAVYLLYFTQVRGDAQPLVKKSKAHRQVVLSAISRQKRTG